ncbi:MAG: alpha-E domain-containing protein, partial [Sphingomonadaceae bacterium]|nr:alpha-E domain-containing protein [Sphingomonadaceae bacterium]
MLARTASSLYWIGRYMERAEFTASLVEATIRLDSLGLRSQSEQTWRSALAVVGATPGFEESKEHIGPFAARRYLTL